MGRALLLICSGMIAVFGIMQLAMQDQYGIMGQRSADYAYATEARNIAFTGIELGIDTLTQNPAWTGGNFVFRQDTVSVSVSYTVDIVDPQDTLRLTATAVQDGDTTDVSTFLTRSNKHANTLAKINGAFPIMAPIVQYKQTGSSSVDGNDHADPPDTTLYGITVTNQSSKDAITTSGSSSISGAGGDPSINVDTAMSFTPFEELIKDLANSSSAQKLEAKTYNEALGSATNPGIFVIDNTITKFSGKTMGYGVLVVRQTGDMESALELTGKSQWNGLILFENGWSFKSTGTSLVNGAVVAGSTSGTSLDVELTGTTDINYNSFALSQYAQGAIDDANVGYVFDKLSIYE